MSTSILTVDQRETSLVGKLADYLELSKPRIVVLELIVAGAAACLAKPWAIDLVLVLHALGATALVAASASVANQWIERDSDSRMRRTALRPLPAGRVSGVEALVLSAVTLLVGTAWLVWQVNLLTALLGLASWLIYVAVYTPLKSRTPANTGVGAVAGAIPILMGWTATGAPLDFTAVVLASVLFLWQIPHFMAIAWLYRHDYAAGGQQMLTVVDPSGIRAGAQAVVAALVLIPVSLVLAVLPHSGSPWIYAGWALVLGTGQLVLALRFAVRRDEPSARMLLRATLFYLPAWLAVLLMVSV